jgi:hypothetical protein
MQNPGLEKKALWHIQRWGPLLTERKIFITEKFYHPMKRGAGRRKDSRWIVIAQLPHSKDIISKT